MVIVMLDQTQQGLFRWFNPTEFVLHRLNTQWLSFKLELIVSVCDLRSSVVQVGIQCFYLWSETPCLPFLGAPGFKIDLSLLS